MGKNMYKNRIFLRKLPIDIPILGFKKVILNYTYLYTHVQTDIHTHTIWGVYYTVWQIFKS